MKLGTAALVGVTLTIMLTTVLSSPFLGFHRTPSNNTVPATSGQPYCDALKNIQHDKLSAKLRNFYLRLKVNLGFSDLSRTDGLVFRLLITAFRNGFYGNNGAYLDSVPSIQKNQVSLELARTATGIKPQVVKDPLDAMYLRGVLKQTAKKPVKFLILDLRVAGHKVAMRLLGQCYEYLANDEKNGKYFAAVKGNGAKPPTYTAQEKDNSANPKTELAPMGSFSQTESLPPYLAQPVDSDQSLNPPPVYTLNSVAQTNPPLKPSPLGNGHSASPPAADNQDSPIPPTRITASDR
ncbi:hypothetical protein H4R33_006503 [Dimargaris cristalligena]|uniref:Uncharacterized protein n=1 Tax=Dimargaris cristalligena TaxID=215637 RepID=A0A4P9ZM61_9FUNG|nr:hypothetical protein H4R33_006503 [Dimargaris cristalligena]RKP34245.1 hypothetical protein BJ085DRAFT_39367 [Dimargaris cristalligena]|eukprot:RKP34245.1 hypothetical protein BJ085DRAFT_39367 [Dimargaris cristalligena]